MPHYKISILRHVQSTAARKYIKFDKYISLPVLRPFDLNNSHHMLHILAALVSTIFSNSVLSIRETDSINVI